LAASATLGGRSPQVKPTNLGIGDSCHHLSQPSGYRSAIGHRVKNGGGMMAASLAGKVALVAGATRGAGRGIAVQLGAAGATVYVTGRTTRSQRSEMNRPETIEETAELVDQAGGRGIAVQVDHLLPEAVRALVDRIRAEQGKLDILVNDIWGATRMEWNKTVWESSLDYGLRTLRLAVDTHAITSHFALPLLIETPGGLVVEVTDGTDAYNAAHYRVSFFYDLAKAAVNRMAFALAHELRSHGATAVSLTPGWLRSEAMLDIYGVTESNWRDATVRQPHFAISESPAFVGRAVVALAQDPNVSRWNGHSLSSGELAQVYGFTDLDGSRPDAWRYVVEVQDAGKPADTTGYR
jgi:NAD(P)-dependent dehydrogenase (short-subunit alcohol dehydrogenase family)